MKFEVKIKGAKELELALKELGPVPARKLGTKALKAGGEIIADYARILVPVLTGQLQDSIAVVPTRERRDSQRTAAIGFRRPGSRYAHLVEFGSRHARAQPFMRPAIDAKGESAIAVISHELWAGVEAQANKAKK